MVNVLLDKIKVLENQLDEIKENNAKAKELLFKLFKECKVSKEKKEKFKNSFLKAVSMLDIKDIPSFYDDKNALRFSSFLEIAKNIKNGYLVIIDVDSGDMEKKKFVLGFVVNKISPFFTYSDDKIIGIIDDQQLKELKNINKIPFYNPQNGDFSEIEIFKVVFDTDEFSVQNIQRAIKVFEDFRIRPSYKNKRYIEYSLNTNKVIDFEQEELNKQKSKFSYIYDEKYPNLEVMLKREIKNIPFILALLERIDEEIEQIKESKGIENIVNRMLNYIEINLPDEGILEEVRFLRQRLSS
ncbi:MAG: hypothetical protein GXO01_02260 [Epsilonproteobacteria bacterium]|nr:hypothetical protein [Campylobacterota bacterium]